MLGVLAIQIRDYIPSDCSKIADLFHDSIHAIPNSVYSSKQKKAWAPTPPNYALWKERLAKKKPFVATVGSKIIGFIELEEDGYIDCLYVHKEHQHEGIASALLSFVRNVAHERGNKILYVEASKVALPFFQRHGFKLKSENTVFLRGQTLVSYLMTTEL